MPAFGTGSKAKLAELHPDLQKILKRGIELADFTITEGHRTEERQNMLFRKGRSKVQWPRSRHNSFPSMAVDIAPYPIDWENREEFTYVAGILVGIASELHADGEIEHVLRWGGDWDRDGDLDDNKFDDLPHLELRKAS